MMASMLKAAAVTLVALALVAFVSACGGSSGGSDDAATGGSDEVAEGVEDEQEGDEVAGHSDGGIVDAGDELVVTLRTENVKFEPDTVTAKVGQTIRLRLDNHDDFLHDYTVDEPEFEVVAADGAVHTDHEDAAATDDDHETDSGAQVSLVPLHIAAEGNEHAELVFEASEPGEYVFYCSVPGHREAGMEGKIIIEE